MALTTSKMIPLGTQAPDFDLPDAISGKNLSLKQLHSNKGTVIMFICNHCPFVQHIQKKLAQVTKKYQADGIQFIAINSNDIKNYPEDAPNKMKAVAKKIGYSFPYLVDDTQSVAKAYQAECTPDFYIFDSTLTCVYRGRFDGSSPGRDAPVTGEDLSRALDALLTGKPVSADQKPSQGCNIKWKSS